MRVFCLTILLFTSIICTAQIPYERLDSISTDVSLRQTDANGKTYRDDDKNEYEISFSKDNFRVLASSRLAYKTAYKKAGEEEVFEIIENIDFSKATGFLTSHQMEVGVFKVYFPEGYNLKKSIFRNGQLLRTENEDHLEFFFTYPVDRKTIDDEIMQLVYDFKIEKNQLPPIVAQNMWNDFKLLRTNIGSRLGVSEESIEAIESFNTKYPNSLHKKMTESWAVDIRVELNRKDAERRKSRDFTDSLCTVYKFRPGMTQNEFLALNPDVKALKMKGYFVEAASQYNPFGFPYTGYGPELEVKASNWAPKGAAGYMIDTRNVVIQCSWNMEDGKSTLVEHTRTFNNLKEKLTQIFEGNIYEKDRAIYNTPITRLIIPVKSDAGSIQYYLVFRFLQADQQHNISIGFTTDRKIAEY